MTQMRSAKKTYRTPSMTTLGKVAQLTQTGTGATDEQLGGSQPNG